MTLNIPGGFMERLRRAHGSPLQQPRGRHQARRRWDDDKNTQKYNSSHDYYFQEPGPRAFTRQTTADWVSTRPRVYTPTRHTVGELINDKDCERPSLKDLPLLQNIKEIILLSLVSHLTILFM